MKVEEGFMTNLTKFYILILLEKKPRHGYELMEELNKLIGKKPSAGQVYPLLKKLVSKKYVKLEIESIGKRKKKVYKLTKQGKQFSSRLLSRFDELVSIAIEPKLTVCAHCGCEVYRGGHSEKIRGKSLKFCCHHCAMSYKKTN